MRPSDSSNRRRWAIHRKAPDFANLEPKTEVFETGIKVIDLVAPFVKGGKIGLFGGAGVGKPEASSGRCQAAVPRIPSTSDNTSV